MRRTEHMTLFHGAGDFLSNWHPAVFTYRGRQFNCVEQFMMGIRILVWNEPEMKIATL